MQTARRTKALALALALALPAQTRAQAPLFIPLVPPVGVILAPLALMILVPLGMELSKTDEKRVRELEARGDWAGVVALATRQLAAAPGDLYWLELRGRALQRQSGCAAAVPDLGQAFDLRMAQTPVAAEPAFTVGLALGQCEMALWDLAAAADTMGKLAALAPQRWEPVYNLGVIRALQGDGPGARTAEAGLRPLNPAMADALLERYIQPAPAQTAPGDAAQRAAASAATADAPAARLPPPLAQTGLNIGNRMLVLPPGRWYAAPAGGRTVMGGHIRAGPVKIDPVALTTLGAFELSASGGLAAAVAFSANAKQAYGISYWNVDEPCTPRDALAVDRFNSPYDQPECLSVRVVTPALARTAADLAPALQAAQAAGATLPAAAYVVRYARYGLDRVVVATWLVPTQRLAGDLAAVQWGHALANGLRPMAWSSEAQNAATPPLGPMR